MNALKAILLTIAIALAGNQFSHAQFLKKLGKKAERGRRTGSDQKNRAKSHQRNRKSDGFHSEPQHRKNGEKRKKAQRER